ncbi:hypothetical protein SKAU_G00120590 [Synaphobranchus kaupii]|uniref:Interleukin-2 receptor subunit beta n=1 Tax=Synaphobranchus kaupii TaxID=118154 RepID=A0A9Q1J2C9_SYNKA|nr:hypothetical protein SKAU_G00120590 [Synaphobranchus kaupii]
MGPLWFPLYLLLLTQPRPSHTHQSLRCLNDYINNITCVWNSTGVPPDTACTLHGQIAGSVPMKETCELEPLNMQNPNLRGCNIVFVGRVRREFNSRSKIQIHVNCDNVTEARTNDYRPRLHIKMNPPGTPDISNYTISWSPGLPLSDMLTDKCIYQLQYKQEDQHWKDIEHILDKKVELNDEVLEKGKSYQVRVRVGVSTRHEGEWSHWSAITSWRSEVGREPLQPGEVIGQPADKWLMIAFGAALLVLLAAISITLPIRYNWVSKVPNPSKYFDVLNSTHGGNFQTWLSPVFSAQSFDVLQYSDDISRVEIFNAKDTNAPFEKEKATVSEQQDVSGQSPSFSNLSYLFPVWSGDRPTEGAAEERKGGAGGTGGGSITMDSSYECLQKLMDRRREPVHPDSGIGEGSEDQNTEAEEDEEGEHTWTETAVRSDPSASLPFLCPLGQSPFQAPFLQHLTAFPDFPFPLANKGERQLVEPCSDGYMSAKEIQNSSSDIMLTRTHPGQ